MSDSERLVDPSPPVQKFVTTWAFVEYGESGGKAVVCLTEEQALAVKRILSSARVDPSPLAREFPIQNVGMIPWALAERAYQDYARRYGAGQSLERLAERGGFSLAELGDHLHYSGSGRLDTAREINRACEFAAKEILEALRAALLVPTPPSSKESL